MKYSFLSLSGNNIASTLIVIVVLLLSLAVAVAALTKLIKGLKACGRVEKKSARKHLSGIHSGICAGILVSMGGCVYLGAESKTAGAILFGTALLVICNMGVSLYTGAIGFLPDQPDTLLKTVLGLVGNILGAVIVGAAISLAMPGLAENAASAVTAKLCQTVFGTFVRACCCGILMYSAVWVYRRKQTPLGIIYCIPVFILSGFEHSIADMFYMAAGNRWDLSAAVYIAVVLIGNTVGAWIIPCLRENEN